MFIIWGLLGRRSFQHSKKIELSDSMLVLSRGRDFVPKMTKYKKKTKSDVSHPRNNLSFLWLNEGYKTKLRNCQV
jgi:hypothetical protein